MIDYLERYAHTFELPIQLNTEAKRLTTEDGTLVLETEAGTITADQVAVATGPFQAPFVPEPAGGLDPHVFQVHSTGYRRPDDVPEGIALVVSGGNTGFQIAKELSTEPR